MTIYDELVARGLIAQVTDEEKVKSLTFKPAADTGSPMVRRQAIIYRYSFFTDIILIYGY